jgi:hypothetical protein
MNKFGGDLSSINNTHLKSPTNTLHNIEQHSMQKDKTESSRKDWLNQTTSDSFNSFLFNDGLCKHHPHLPVF